MTTEKALELFKRPRILDNVFLANCWYFFPACEGITQLLPEYSTITEWREIF
jgi:hypothetical protein|nr:MAG TPA: hypothetical protein [Caudoviricetes sp.]